MVQPTLSNAVLILLGDGGTPTETFAAPCGVNTKSAKFTNNLGEEVLLDCDDPLGVQAFVTRWFESSDTELQVSGRVSKQAWPTWRSWIDATGSDAVRNVQIEVVNTPADVGGYWTLPVAMSDFEIGTEGSSTMTMSMTLMGAGPRVWTAAPAS